MAVGDPGRFNLLVIVDASRREAVCAPRFCIDRGNSYESKPALPARVHLPPGVGVGGGHEQRAGHYGRRYRSRLATGLGNTAVIALVTAAERRGNAPLGAGLMGARSLPCSQSSALTHIFIGIFPFLIYHDSNWVGRHNMLLALVRVDASPKADSTRSRSVAESCIPSHSRHKVLLLSYWWRASCDRVCRFANGPRVWQEACMSTGIVGCRANCSGSKNLPEFTQAYNRLPELTKRLSRIVRSLECGQG